MVRSVVVGLAALVLVGAVVVLPADPAGTEASSVSQTGGFDRTVFGVTAYENGSVQWSISLFTPLENATEEANFQSFARDFERNDTQLFADFRRQATGLVAEAENETDRRMTARNFARSARIDYGGSTTGVVRMSFLWTNASVVRGDRVILADIYGGTAGLTLGADQQYVVQAGPELDVVDARPDPDSRTTIEPDSVSWRGDRQFAPNRPRVDLAPESTPTPTSTATPTSTGGGVPGSGNATTATPTATPAGNTAGDDGDTGGPGALGMLVAAVLLVALAGVVLTAWRTGAIDRLRRGGSSEPASVGGDDPTGGAAAEAAEEPAVPDEELLSDSDRVVRLLEDNGGRMKQVRIVEETDWSKSKVSMLLSDMEDEGEISKLRVGRENIISLAGHEPDAAGSPFDDEE
ncbi:MAG: helix-turn-helix transcriptional regulator [Haloarculaceae archaeon]